MTCEKRLPEINLFHMSLVMWDCTGESLCTGYRKAGAHWSHEASLGVLIPVEVFVILYLLLANTAQGQEWERYKSWPSEVTQETPGIALSETHRTQKWETCRKVKSLEKRSVGFHSENSTGWGLRVMGQKKHGVSSSFWSGWKLLILDGVGFVRAVAG